MQPLCIPPAKDRRSQNHRMFRVGRDLCGSPSPTLLPKQGHPEQAAQDRVQAGLEYLQRRRRKGKREASSGQKFCLTILTTSAADASPECPEVPSLPTEVINGFSSVAAELGEEETRKTLEKQKCSSPPPRAAWQRTRLVSSHHFNNLPLLFFSPQSFQFQTVQTFP